MVTFELPRGRGLRRQPVGRRRAVRAAPHRSRCLGGRCSAPRHGCKPCRDGARRSPAPARYLEPLLKALSCTCQNLLFNIHSFSMIAMMHGNLGLPERARARAAHRKSPVAVLFTDPKAKRRTERRPRHLEARNRSRRRHARESWRPTGTGHRHRSFQLGISN